jgi:hypothetical protein
MLDCHSEIVLELLQICESDVQEVNMMGLSMAYCRLQVFV